MPRLYHINFYTPTRKKLRNNATHTEKVLWTYLRKRQLHGLKFRRQEGIGSYIVDFYCPEKRLAIELDGDYHNTPEQQAYDAERTKFLNMCFIQVVRFWNEEVLGDITKVLQKLEVEVLSPTPKAPP